MNRTKPFKISKEEVEIAYKLVKANKGSAGIDNQSLEDFERDLDDNLYKLWNRLSSGSYMPPPVRHAEIPKGGGEMRPLGIPTVGDRIAQMVVKQRMEPGLERYFHPHSFGYRPKRSALDALDLARKRCWDRAWVLDMDIKGFFDAIDHKLLMLAVRKHIRASWLILYVERWLKAPVQYEDGHLEKRDRGTPQGGVVSPLLANLFLHYVFDIWIEQYWSGIQFERYADDIICHCRSEEEAKTLKAVIKQRFSECGLTLHPEKTKIVYCKSSSNRLDYPVVSFDFLGYTFKPRLAKDRRGVFFVTFTPAISSKSVKDIKADIRSWPVFRDSSSTIMDIARFSRARILGWLNYYGKYRKSEFHRVLFYLDEELTRWARKKYKRLKKSKRKAVRWVNGVRQREPKLFIHWNLFTELKTVER